MTVTDDPWWKNASIYQIYPASFKDSNGDGLGDLPGILSELDYIKSLGVDAIWICPMYDSPQHDMGYDISDYEKVYPPYGTVEDMERIIAASHERGLRVLLDLVINHTSDQHAWFKESRSSKASPKRDWYVWRPAKHDPVTGARLPPNNWRSNFGGSAWEWDEPTQEYYLHLFCVEQPDLNWENDETRAAIYESAMEFWLRKGIDGFRVDTVNMYSKPQPFPNAPIVDPHSPWQGAASLYCNGPRMHEFLAEMHAILAKHGAMTVGELPHTHDRAHVLRYVSASARQLDMTFMFDVVDVGFGADQRFDTTPRAWRLRDLKDAVARTQDLIDGSGEAWTTSFMENHDQARSVSRFGCERTRELRERSAKMLAAMLASLSGTLFLYQGQEIGMVNAPAEWGVGEYKDVDSRNFAKWMEERYGVEVGRPRAMAALQHLARDHARLPMQWDDGYQAGFTTSDAPWMRVHDNHGEVNVKSESARKDSVLAFWRQMLRTRKEYAPSLVYGTTEIRDLDDEKTFVFEKRGKGQNAVVALNFTEEEVPVEVPGKDGKKLVAGNYADEVEGVLRPFEARVWVGA
ncbi:glucan-alpha-glucosidase [Diplodia corticola]|uniref:Glucan-alpha-glucosidase n=1 Tax=Diplodia corticola TaxID=236234 RepID=A0A1J9RD47_9PEZI|nr:glucan-alpha-glucosidase [Diplodia corticola]OJD38034.1 glucan-alpha-glucosidase [Diplodia corticola]